MQRKHDHVNYNFDVDRWMEFVNGSEKAFTDIYDKYFALLYGYGMQFCADKAVIKDCIQDLFLELWSKKTKLAHIQSLKYYLYKSLRRKVIKTLSRKDFSALKHKTLSFEFNLQSGFPEEIPLIEKEIIRDNKIRIQWALKRLTSRQKEAVFLKFYENLSYDEIASIMGLSEAKYARKLIYRSLGELKAVLRKYKDSLVITSLSLLMLLIETQNL